MHIKTRFRKGPQNSCEWEGKDTYALKIQRPVTSSRMQTWAYKYKISWHLNPKLKHSSHGDRFAPLGAQNITQTHSHPNTSACKITLNNIHNINTSPSSMYMDGTGNTSKTMCGTMCGTEAHSNTDTSPNMSHFDGTRKTDITINVRHLNSVVAKILDKEKVKWQKTHTSFVWTSSEHAIRKFTARSPRCSWRCCVEHGSVSYWIATSNRLCWSKQRKSYTPSKY